MPDTTREREVINAFCERMSILFRVQWRAIRFPEPPDIDAQLDCGGVRTALDHTVLNSFEAHRLSDVRIKAIARILSMSLVPVDRGSSIRILFPAKGLPKATEDMLRKGWLPQLKSIVAQVPLNGQWQAINLLDPPCKIWVERVSSRNPTVTFGRMLHSESKSELKADLRRALKDKNLQLASSKREGWGTILLIETTDLATINEVLVSQSFASVASTTRHDYLDSVFLFDDGLRDGKNHMVWPLKYKGAVDSDLRWMDEFRQAQGALLWGWTDRGKPFIDESGQIPRAEFSRI